MSAEEIEAGPSPEEIAALMAAAAAAEKEARAKAQAAAEAAEAEAAREAAARAAEAQAQMQEAALAALQDEAEAENAERDALAASLAAMAAANANAKPTPLPVLDAMDAPHGSFGPTFQTELAAAGVQGFHFSVSEAQVVFGGGLTEVQRAAVVAVIEAHDPATSDMPRQRQIAFDTAMIFGNRITEQVERKWSNIERQSFTAQEIEAKAIMAGEVMAADAMLPALAAHKGISVQEYAQQVLDNAAQYRHLAIAAVILRRGADGLLSPDIDTSEKLSAAMDQLREQAAKFVTQFGLEMP